MTTFVDLHILQNLPPSCVNRDDSGSPKTAVYGGVRRLRVSSQSWKRATRQFFETRLDPTEVGIRTKRVVELVASRIAAQDPDLAGKAEELAKGVFAAAKIRVEPPKNKKDGTPESGYLLFLSPSQVDRLARLAVAAEEQEEKVDAKMAKAIFKEDHAIDMALFGRMVAEDTDLNIDASCQVAHAISTHPVETEHDFFTAVDDAKEDSEENEDAGAGMMGTVEFASATIYRYATVNLDMLKENLGSPEAALRALEVFIDGFALAMPTGKQNTFANRTLPHLVSVSVRTDQPVSLVGAFEEPVKTDATSGYLGRSVKRLAEHAAAIGEEFGLRPATSFVAGLADQEITAPLGEHVGYAELASKVRDAVSPLLSKQESA
ncbi:type I-E CRISPR-associated protein Cas7/Cse4/CasC [Buchananella felis]|uniref:type I-E CRISPR-associated protein Cas7/Cse4/CasC n=1 Tax=Buchananella felis TaxID=3231492 RepID=UPI003529A97A